MYEAYDRKSTKLKSIIKVGDTVKLKGNFMAKYKDRRYKVVKVLKDELEVTKIGIIGHQHNITIPRSMFVKMEGENDR